MQNKILCVFFLIFHIFSKIFKYPGKIPEICQFPKLSRKIPKIPENSRISGKVETLADTDSLLISQTGQKRNVNLHSVLVAEWLSSMIIHFLGLYVAKDVKPFKISKCSTVEPRYKEVGYNKTLL